MSTLILITFKGESEGDRKKFFSILRDGRYGAIKHLCKAHRHIYVVCLETNDDPEDIQQELVHSGIFLLQILTEGGHVIFRNKKYAQEVPEDPHRRTRVLSRTMK